MCSMQLFLNNVGVRTIIFQANVLQRCSNARLCESWGCIQSGLFRILLLNIVLDIAMKWLPSIGRLTHRTNWGLFSGGLGDSDPKSSCSMGKLTQRTTFRLTGDVFLGLGGSEPESASLVCFVVSVNKSLVLLLILLLICVYLFLLCDFVILQWLQVWQMLCLAIRRNWKTAIPFLKLGWMIKLSRKELQAKKQIFNSPCLQKVSLKCKARIMKKKRQKKSQQYFFYYFATQNIKR